MSDREERGTDLALTFGAVAVNAYTLAWVLLITLFVEAFCIALFGTAPVILISFVMHGLVMFSVMRTLLSGGEVVGKASLLTVTGEWPGGFIFRLILLSIPGFLALVLVSGLVVQADGYLSAMILGLPAAMIVQAGVFAVFGTMLPRMAEGRPGRATKAMLRGEGSVGTVFMALMTGPVLADLALQGVFLALSESGVPFYMTAPGAEHLSILGGVMEIILRVAAAFIAAYYAAVLTRIYLGLREPEGRELKR